MTAHRYEFVRIVRNWQKKEAENSGFNKRIYQCRSAEGFDARIDA
jgi:hypothetical protein